MLNGTIVIIALALGSYFAFSKRLSHSSNWKATVTPLASIMGSGFLISAPLLAGIVGNLAVIYMALLLVLAYLVGEAIRFNIRHFEPIENEGHGLAQGVGSFSRIVLTCAYFISITYYLQLLSAFLLNSVNIKNEIAANCITTALLVSIGGIGMWRGLDELEKVEKYAIALNLGIIGALLAGLGIYNFQLTASGLWELPRISSSVNFRDLRVLLGLLIVVQGFETSRYLGQEHTADQRIRTMRTAQLIATGIYLTFIVLATILFHKDLGSDVTAIISMSTSVASALPLLLSVAAIGSQFSASVADTSGAGGLIQDIIHAKLSIRATYLLVTIVTVALTWVTNVNEIIAYASRAFALYYTLQCSVAWIVARQNRTHLTRPQQRLWLFGALALICLLVFLLGIPSG
ncbi:hypothetical protein DO021_04440 [Desulfobacter hydrogenophilus]|uniref:Amino acid permease n=1 Tax=Desulfobacter hydrogenophilus TaxID=2291 RepID=A0A328FJM9_9BACT|nr:hypothetical protein [Desulfobacter hydrogenophilus]NDY70795.1 hypothetical protein [Desulfobacter hydrogenophilus]QBH11567.1 hypothetical protein EYB58_00705 [Desulfobacter hydrogenophilus]RAM03115.1 hypothetical protein DO021_04440 [Desulfobacter hydrogenophilus]